MSSASSNNRVARLIRPEKLKKDDPLIWSTGTGIEAWELFIAAITGDLLKAKDLLDKNPDLIRSRYEYRSAMTFAVQENQLEMVKFLLSRGANPVNSGTSDPLLTIATDRGYREMQQLLRNALPGSGSSVNSDPIAAAIKSRDLSSVKNLLNEFPALLNAPDSFTNCPIHWAVLTRQIEVIDELLERGADINAKRFDGARPVQLINGDYHFRSWGMNFSFTPLQILDHLQLKGAYIDICTACAIGDINRVRELLDLDPSLANKVSDYVTYYIGSGAPIKNAAAGGHIEIVKLLLERGADPNIPEEGIAPRGHALHSAVYNGHIEIVKLLLKHGAYPNVEIESSADTLSAAIARNDQPMIELLCSHGAARRVHLLAYYGDIETAAAVFAANPEMANDPEALENACSEGHESFIRLMLHYHPDLPRKIAVGVRSRGTDAATKSLAIGELLFGHGMNPNLSNWLRITPLHRFAQRGDIENAKLFIAKGADLNARDEEICSTPLGWAAKYGKIDMVQLLLERGAKINLPDDPEWATALSWSNRKGNKEILALLKKNGAY